MRKSKKGNVCPDCHGTKGVFAFVDSEDFSGVDNIPCVTCHGTGYVPLDYAARVAEGWRLRKERKQRGERLGPAARRMGLSVSELSDRELGRSKEWPTKL